MMLKKSPLYISLIVLISLGLQPASAQERKDSLAQQTIDIYNVYRPSLPAAAKINLNAGLPVSREEKPNLVYSIPSQNLNFSYQPIALQPLAMGVDTSHKLLYNNYIKAGIGNHNTPLIQVGLSNGNNLPYQIGLNFNHLSSKGKIEDQQFSHTDLLLHGKYFTPTHLFHADVGFKRKGFRYYGYDHDLHTSSPDSTKQAYNIISLNIGGENVTENSLGLNYQPKIGFSNLFDNYQRSESTFSLELPIQKDLGNDISVGAAFLANLSGYKDKNAQSISNNLVEIKPFFNISKEKFKLRAGVNPTWSKEKFYLLPDIINETNLLDNNIILSSGWTVYIHKNSYQNILKENPFINGINEILNTRIAERYTGIKGSINSHFDYNVKIASVDYSHRPLYLTNPARNNKFEVLEEDELKSFQLHGELGYTLGENFQTKLSGTWHNYYDQQTEEEPWGLRPFESNLNIRFNGIKNLSLTADLFALSGSWYQNDLGEKDKTKGIFDVNVGGSYNFGNHFGVWLNLNNIFDTHYERWNQYPSIGFNILGGIMVQF